MNAVLFSCMRNEAPWLLEWVAYHRLIGFDRVVVYTNDCTDLTVDLLDALQGMGLVERRDNPVPDGVSAQLHAASRVGEDPVCGDGDWVMWLDPDEFLNIQLGQGNLSDLVDRLDGAAGYAIHWRLFGSAGRQGWQPEPVLARFAQAARRRLDLHEVVKVFFRWGPSIEKPSVHRPELRPSFRERGLSWWHGPGNAVPEVFYYHRYNRDAMPALRLPQITGQYSWAQINHYAVRSVEEYSLKRVRGSGVYADHHTDEYWQRYDRNEQTEQSVQRHLPALRALLSSWLANGDLAALQARATRDLG